MRVMKKVMLGVAGALALVIVIVLGLAASKPSTFTVERSAKVDAPAAAVFANLEDFHRWSAWSPWEKLDPNLTRNYSGAPKGQGAVYDWLGNKAAGKGRMTIVEAQPDAKLVIRLEFIEPFPADNQTIFTLTPAGAGTEVNWRMTGPNAFMGKLISVFVSMDSMVGGDFERGLANLKKVSEGGN
jgi:uncharacterized protein YndB with AHSA1/START domain